MTKGWRSGQLRSHYKRGSVSRNLLCPLSGGELAITMDSHRVRLGREAVLRCSARRMACWGGKQTLAAQPVGVCFVSGADISLPYFQRLFWNRERAGCFRFVAIDSGPLSVGAEV